MPMPIERIKRIKLKEPVLVFNMSVEDDESYIAHGFVSHNCRCQVFPVAKDYLPDSKVSYTGIDEWLES